MRLERIAGGSAALVFVLAFALMVHDLGVHQSTAVAMDGFVSTTTSSTSTSTTLAPPPSTTTTTTVPRPVVMAPPPPAPSQVAADVHVGSPCTPSFPTAPASTQLASPTVVGLGYSSTPGGPTTGYLPPATWGGPTVRPVLASSGSWLEVGLDSRPNGSSGWVPAKSVTLSTTNYFIVISTRCRTLTVFQGGSQIYSSPVGVGRPGSPTPLGPSFIDAFVDTPRNLLGVYGARVAITASHSNVYTDFDGGDGTVGIHQYPSDPGSTRGVASSHGCVRVSPSTIAQVLAVPVGTPIDIIA